MHDVLISALPVLLPVLTLLNLLLLVLLDKAYRSNTRKKITFCMTLVSFGLCYDALILSLGIVLKEGALLKILSQLRFVSHGFLIPLLLPICAYALKWKPAGMKKIWVVTLVLMLLGLAAGFLVKLSPITLGSSLRYASDKELTPGFVTAIENLLSYAPVIVLIAAGILAAVCAVFFLVVWSAYERREA